MVSVEAALVVHHMLGLKTKDTVRRPTTSHLQRLLANVGEQGCTRDSPHLKKQSWTHRRFRLQQKT